jgi:transposase, IS30 family
VAERPAEADDRPIPGHREVDLMIGLERSAIGKLVEQTTPARDVTATKKAGTCAW